MALTRRGFAARQQWMVLALLLLSAVWNPAHAAPANDNFAGARLVIGTSGNFAGTTVTATTEVGEPFHAGGFNSVWFRWVAPASGPVVFTTDHADTLFDTTLSVYTNAAFTNLTLIAANNDSPNASRGANLGAGFSSYVQFSAVAGTTYRIALAGIGGATGPYRLFWSMGGYGGTFQFTSSNYEASEREASPPVFVANDEFTLRGGRATITRRDGYSGRVRVTYRVGDTATAAFGARYTVPGAAQDNSTFGVAHDVIVVGTNALVTTGAGLRVIDVSNPLVPVFQRTLGLSGSPSRMVRNGNLLYIASGSSGLHVVSITNAANPALVGTFNTFGNALEVVLNTAATLAYVANGNGLHILNLNGAGLPISVAGSYVDRTPSTVFNLPVSLRILDAVSPAQVTSDELSVAAGHGMVADTEFRLRALPGGALPALLFPTNNYFTRFINANTFQAALTPGGGAVNFTNAGAISVQLVYHTAVNSIGNTFTIPNHGLLNNDEVRFIGTSLPGNILPGTSYYVQVIDVNTFQVSLTPGFPIAAFTPVDLTSSAYADFTVESYAGRMSPGGNAHGLALNAAQTHVVMTDDSGGSIFIDVQNPAVPVQVARIPSASVSQGVKTIGSGALVADGASGMRIISIFNPASPVLLSTVAATSANSISLGNGLVYISTSTGVVTYNLGLGLVMGSIPLPGQVRSVFPSTPFSFAAVDIAGLQVLSTPTGVPNTVTGSYLFSAFQSYTNSVIFEDWQTSASFFVLPTTFGSVSSTVDLDILDVRFVPGESQSLLPPKISVVRNAATMQILDQDVGVNFERVRMRVSERLANVQIRVNRGLGVPNDSVTSWAINTDEILPHDGQVAPANNVFPLDAGSDYATPGADFDVVSGTLSWPQGLFQRTISIPLNDDNLVEFNEDFRVDLFLGPNQTGAPGAVDHIYVTLVTDANVDAEQAAGAVDPSHLRDYFNLTSPPFNPTPGANDQVHAVALDAAQNVYLGGDFTAVNTDNNYPRLARYDFNGAVDTTFQPGTGPNSSVLSIQLANGQVFIAGKFSSYNSQQAKGIARLSTSGALDPSFNIGNGVPNPFATPVRALAVHPSGPHVNKVVAVGDFTSFAGQVYNRIVRLLPSGSIDTAFNIGTGANGPIYAVKILQGTGGLNLDNCIVVAGDFTIFNGQPVNRLVRLLPSGIIDPTFNSGSGANAAIYGLDVRANGKMVVGGDFTTYDLLSRPRVAQINADGTLDESFEVGYGTDDSVYTVNYDPSGRVLIGGPFRNFNLTRRAGYARLLTTGYLDTSFLDIAYNHFAGLPMRFSIMTDPKPFVRSMAIQTNGDIIIGGSFQRVGGGNRNVDPDGIISLVTGASPWRDGTDTPIVTPYWQNRDDIRNRSNIARVKGGATPGPGNIGFSQTEYTVDEFSSILFVTINRTNTDPTPNALGDVRADFFTQSAGAAPGAAVLGVDFGVAGNSQPRWSTTWNNQQMVSHASSGPNNTVLGTSRVELPITNDSLIEGDESFVIRMNNPQSDLALGGQAILDEGEIIPLGVALGRETARITIVDDDFEPSFISFSKPRFSVGETDVTATVEVVRSGNTARSVSVDYLTTEHLGLAGGDIEETAAHSVDFTGVFGRLTFEPGQTNLTFSVPIGGIL